MSFVVTTGNKQYLVKNGQIIIVDRIEADVDSTVELPVAYAGEKAVKSIKATVLRHQKGEKIRVVKYKSKSNYHRQYGFRAFETVLKIEGEFDNSSAAPTKAKKSANKASKAATATTAKTSTKAATKPTKAKAAKEPKADKPVKATKASKPATKKTAK